MEHLDTVKLQAILNSPEGTFLLQQLQKADGNLLQQAVQAAKAGDYTRAQAILQPLLTSDIRNTAERINRKID